MQTSVWRRDAKTSIFVLASCHVEVMLYNMQP